MLAHDSYIDEEIFVTGLMKDDGYISIVWYGIQANKAMAIVG